MLKGVASAPEGDDAGRWRSRKSRSWLAGSSASLAKACGSSSWDPWFARSRPGAATPTFALLSVAPRTCMSCGGRARDTVPRRFHLRAARRGALQDDHWRSCSGPRTDHRGRSGPARGAPGRPPVGPLEASRGEPAAPAYPRPKSRVQSASRNGQNFLRLHNGPPPASVGTRRRAAWPRSRLGRAVWVHPRPRISVGRPDRRGDSRVQPGQARPSPGMIRCAGSPPPSDSGMAACRLPPAARSAIPAVWGYATPVAAMAARQPRATPNPRVGDTADSACPGGQAAVWTRISTRRLSWRPASVPLSARGSSSPRPIARSREGGTPSELSSSRTAAARRSERS
jgi:hypothetical protein